MGRMSELAAAKAESRLLEKVMADPNSGCWLWTGGLDKAGYGKFYYIPAEERPIWLAHRAAYRIFVGSIPTGLDIIHSCDVRCCVNPYHLRPGTSRDNMNDMVAKGRGPNFRRANNPRAKLSEAEVKYIRGSTLPQKILGAVFGVGQTQISKIKVGRAWAE